MAQEIGQLRRALETRDIIGQAKGMLMERFDIDAAAAFDLLVRLSQSSNTPVAEIAQKLVKLEHSRR
jgi:AmiR/NasT family two-component response regulator